MSYSHAMVEANKYRWIKTMTGVRTVYGTSKDFSDVEEEFSLVVKAFKGNELIAHTYTNYTNVKEFEKATKAIGIFYNLVSAVGKAKTIKGAVTSMIKGDPCKGNTFTPIMHKGHAHGCKTSKWAEIRVCRSHSFGRKKSKFIAADLSTSLRPHELGALRNKMHNKVTIEGSHAYACVGRGGDYSSRGRLASDLSKVSLQQ